MIPSRPPVQQKGAKMKRMLCVLAAALLSVPVAHADVLDQSQTLAGGYGSVHSERRMAQSFTPGITGYLRRIRLLLENYDATSPIAVSIQPIESHYNFPSGTQIAGGSGTIPVASLTPAGNPLWIDVTFDYPWIVADVEYAVILSIASSGSLKWHHNSANVYSRGRELAWEYIGWYPVYISRVDAAFETYVLEPVTRFTPPPPRVITPCSDRVCPETKGGLAPADSVDVSCP